jgi:DNA-binding transcriptional LysR family regulator
MEFRHLRYVIAVAEEGHITRAAERLGIQQPPLSRLIKAVEQEIKVQLFRRVPRGVELTDAGRAFLDGARATFANLDRTLESARRTARGEEGRISVGFTTSAAFHPLVPGIIREFRRSFPLVSVTLAEDSPGGLIERMGSDQLDAAFIRTPIADLQGLVIHPLLEEPMVVALPDKHALARGKARAVLPVKGAFRRNIRRLPATWRTGMAARCSLRGVPRGRLQSPHRPGSASCDVNASTGRRRDRHFHCSRFTPAIEHSRRELSPPQGGGTQGPTKSRFAARRDICGGSPIAEFSPACSKELSPGLRRHAGGDRLPRLFARRCEQGGGGVATPFAIARKRGVSHCALPIV